MPTKQQDYNQVKFQKLIKSSHITLPDAFGHTSAITIAYYFFTYVFYNEQVYIWIALVLSTFFIRMGTYWLLHNHLNLSPKQWANTLTFLSIISSTAWGSLIFVIPNDPVYILTMALLFVGCMGGALGAVGNNFSVYVSFATPMSILLIVRLQDLDGDLFYSTALTITLYSIAAAYISYKYTQTTHKEALLNLKNKRLIRQLKKEKKTAEKANTDKSRFLASASHDLRQPLQAMNLFAESLKQQIKDDEQQVSLGKLRKSMQDMNNLLSSLLDISKLDAGLVSVEKTSFLLFPLLHKLEKNFSLQNNKPVSLSIDTNIKTLDGNTHASKASDVIIHSDPILFENIVSNLFSNALKYTFQGSVSISCAQTRNRYILYIKDTGIGIAAKEKSKVFDAFYQVGNIARDRSQGIGLGLSIVQHLCKLLKHRLVMHSELGKGTCFEIHLPAATEVSHTRQPLTPVQHNIEATILVVDDDHSILDGMQSMINHWGCNVLTASSFDEAIPILKNYPNINLMLVDYRLQDHCLGTTVIAEARKTLNKPKLPAIIISGDTDPKRMQDMEKQGFEILHKPIKPAQLRALMNHLLCQQTSHTV